MVRYGERTLIRLWSRVRKTDTCWNWTGSVTSEGYGTISVNGKSAFTHRLAYEECYGPIPKDKQIDHLCRNRRCANPSHMEVVTSRENTLRGNGICAQQARRAVCPKGHPYEGYNLYVHRGKRYCRICRNVNWKNSMRNRKALATAQEE